MTEIDRQVLKQTLDEIWDLVEKTQADTDQIVDKLFRLGKHFGFHAYDREEGSAEKAAWAIKEHIARDGRVTEMVEKVMKPCPNTP